MTTLETNAAPTWATRPHLSFGAESADRGESPLAPQQTGSLLPVWSFALVVAVSLLSLYVQVLNEQMQRAELFHQAFLATVAVTQTAAAPGRESTPSRPPVQKTAAR